MIRSLAGLAILGAVAGSANAAFFSFASDTADASWTFTGQGNQITSALSPNSTIKLEVSDNGQNPVSFVTRFSANFTLSYITSIQVGSSFQHLYNLDGSFAFRDASDNSLIMSATFTGGSMTALGGRRSWGASGTAFGADPETAINYTLHKDIEPLGLTAGSLPIAPDFNFTLTVLNTSGIIPYPASAPGRGVALDANFLPSLTWYSEGSYSGSAQVPTPGSMALLSAAGLMVARRRRK